MPGGDLGHEDGWEIRRRPLLYLGPLLLGLVFRVVYWVFVTPDWVPDSDADQYLRLARALAGGDGYALVFPQLEMHPTAFRPPLYPVILSLTQWISGDDALWPARVLSILIGLGVIALTVEYARRLAGATAGLIAGCAVAVMPSLLANDTITLTEPLALLLLLSVLIALDQRRPVLVGVFAGALLLTRPNAYLVLLIALAFLLAWVGPKRTLWAFLAAVIVVTPWLVRNQIQVGTFRPTTSEGFNLAAIYAPPAQELETFVDPVFDPWYEGTRFKLLQFDEAEWNSELTELALDEIRSNPTYVARVFSDNVLNYFEIRTAKNEFAERADGRNIGFRRATLPVFYLFLVAGVAGLALNVGNRRLWPGLLIVVQFAVLSLLLVSPPRLRAPFDLMLCVGIGLLAATIRQRLRPAPPADDADDDAEVATSR
jgi:4-amino-4-deoxy-L-arabinose transferase-like glycosyltransferase